MRQIRCNAGKESSAHQEAEDLSGCKNYNIARDDPYPLSRSATDPSNNSASLTRSKGESSIPCSPEDESSCHVSISGDAPLSASSNASLQRRESQNKHFDGDPIETNSYLERPSFKVEGFLTQHWNSANQSQDCKREDQLFIHCDPEIVPSAPALASPSSPKENNRNSSEFFDCEEHPPSDPLDHSHSHLEPLPPPPSLPKQESPVQIEQLENLQSSGLESLTHVEQVCSETIKNNLDSGSGLTQTKDEENGLLSFSLKEAELLVPEAGVALVSEGNTCSQSHLLLEKTCSAEQVLQTSEAESQGKPPELSQEKAEDKSEQGRNCLQDQDQNFDTNLVSLEETLFNCPESFTLNTNSQEETAINSSGSFPHLDRNLISLESIATCPESLPVQDESTTLEGTVVSCSESLVTLDGELISLGETAVNFSEPLPDKNLTPEETRVNCCQSLSPIDKEITNLEDTIDSNSESVNPLEINSTSLEETIISESVVKKSTSLEETVVKDSESLPPLDKNLTNLENTVCPESVPLLDTDSTSLELEIKTEAQSSEGENGYLEIVFDDTKKPLKAPPKFLSRRNHKKSTKNKLKQSGKSENTPSGSLSDSHRKQTENTKCTIENTFSDTCDKNQTESRSGTTDDTFSDIKQTQNDSFVTEFEETPLTSILIDKANNFSSCEEKKVLSSQETKSAETRETDRNTPEKTIVTDTPVVTDIKEVEEIVQISETSERLSITDTKDIGLEEKQPHPLLTEQESPTEALLPTTEDLRREEETREEALETEVVEEEGEKDLCLRDIERNNNSENDINRPPKNNYINNSISGNNSSTVKPEEAVAETVRKEQEEGDLATPLQTTPVQTTPAKTTPLQTTPVHATPTSIPETFPSEHADLINESPLNRISCYGLDEFEILGNEASKLVEELGRSDSLSASQVTTAMDDSNAASLQECQSNVGAMEAMSLGAKGNRRNSLMMDGGLFLAQGDSEAGPEIATGLTSSDLKCASQFFRDAAELESQIRRNIACSIGSMSDLGSEASYDTGHAKGHTHASPPREERSAPEGTSSPDPRSLEDSEGRGRFHTDNMAARGTQEVTDLLKKQALEFEEKLMRQGIVAGEKEKELQELLKGEQKQIQEVTASRDALLKLMEQYKGMLGALVGEKAKASTGQEEKIKGLEAEKAQAVEDLSNVEAAFSDVHRKYERTKQIVDSLRRNEDTLRNAVTDYESKLLKQERKFAELQKHIEEKVKTANDEFESLRRSSDQEMTKMGALLKKAEMKIISLQEALDRKARENHELTQLCDDLISKVGT